VTVTPTEIQVLNSNDTYDDVTWGSVTEANGVTIKNGKLTADFEYFHMGERGDQYRMVGFPDYVPVKYLVDPTKEYDYIGIHYAYVGPNESCQKSEKDITIVVPRAAGDTTAANPGTLTASIVSAINTAMEDFTSYTKSEADDAFEPVTP
jgi:subtilisin family serine protease